jgi:hypothetical protein
MLFHKEVASPWRFCQQAIRDTGGFHDGKHFNTGLWSAFPTGFCAE